MHYRPLGRTGLNVSVLSYGASPLGGVFRATDDNEGIRTVHLALDLGINFIDTSPYYGATKSETVPWPRSQGRAARALLSRHQNWPIWRRHFRFLRRACHTLARRELCAARCRSYRSAAVPRTSSCRLEPNCERNPARDGETPRDGPDRAHRYHGSAVENLSGHHRSRAAGHHRNSALVLAATN